jgi:hypothetical protein
MLVISCSEQEKEASPYPSQQSPSKTAYSHSECNENNEGAWYPWTKCREHCDRDPIAIDSYVEECEFTFCWTSECSGTNSAPCFEVFDNGGDYDTDSG